MEPRSLQDLYQIKLWCIELVCVDKIFAIIKTLLVHEHGVSLFPSLLFPSLIVSFSLTLSLSLSLSHSHTHRHEHRHPHRHKHNYNIYNLYLLSLSLSLFLSFLPISFCFSIYWDIKVIITINSIVAPWERERFCSWRHSRKAGWWCIVSSLQ